MKEHNCSFLWNSFTLDHIGNVFSCCHMQPTVIGNIYKRKLADLINTKEIVEYRIKSQKGKLKCYETCNLFDKSTAKNFSDRDPWINYEELKKIHIHFGNKCNIKCIMCSHPEKYLKDSRLLNEKFLIGNVNLSPFEDIVIQGGEPLYLQNCLRYLDFLQEVKKEYILLTNGLLINDKLADLLSRNAKIVSISLNAFYPRSHEEINRGSKFSTVMKNIKRLQLAKENFRTNCRINGRMTITPPTINEIPIF